MAQTVHHAAKARAAKFGAEILVLPEGGFRLLQTATGLLSEGTYDKVGEATEELSRDEVAWEEPRAPKGNTSGVMAISYHKAYSCNPHGPGCGDHLDIALRDAFTTATGVALAALQECAESVGLWNTAWVSLNPGMQRMNASNRIRAFLRNNPEATIRIGDTTGRFGVAYREPAPKKSKAKKAA